jgi:hypothetical protein
MPKSSPHTTRLVAGGVAVAAVAGLAIAIATRGSSTKDTTAADPLPTAPATTPSSAASSTTTATATTAAAVRATATTASGNGGGDTAAGPCENVYLASAPSGAVVGRLCTEITVKNKRPTAGTVVFTSAADCTGTVRLRLSGIDTEEAEWAQHTNATCAAGKATAKFTITVRIPSGTEVCGLLESEDRFSAALTCVPIA